MADNNGKALCERAGRLFSKKEGLNSLHQEIALQFYPERADFTGERTFGEEFASHLFDGSPVRYRRDLGNAFSSMLRPRGQPWFRATIEDEEAMEEPGIGAWLEAATRVMRRMLYPNGAKSQFVRATKSGDHDYAAFGNAVLSVDPSRTGDGLLFRNWHLRDCAWAEDDEGTIDTLFRKISMTARQIEAAFPDADLHQEIRRACEQNPDQEFKLLHAMLPAKDYEYASGKKAPRGLKFASVYIDDTHQRILKEAASRTFRYVVPRWQTLTGSPYGVSPAAMVSLADARMLQSMARVLIEAGEKAVDPPMVATEEAIRSEVNLYAGGITWTDREYDERLGLSLRAVELGKNVGLGVELLDRTRHALLDAWYLSKLALPQTAAKTAYETSQLVEQFIREAIPLFEPLETEYNLPLLEAAADTLMHGGAFGPPDTIPEALRGREMQFSFSNPLQDAIEKNKVMQFQTTMGVVGAAAQFDPNAVHEVNIRKAAREAVRGSGAPLDWLTEPEHANAQAQAQDDKQAISEVLAGAAPAADALQKVADASVKFGQAGQASAMPSPF